jgi:hypothetical protein
MTSFIPPLTRRHFLESATAAGALSLIPSLRVASRAPVLSGTEFQPEIGPVPMNVTGRPMTATGINGQIPPPSAGAKATR